METDVFAILAVILQVDTLASYLILICMDYVFRMLIDLMKKVASR